MIPHKQAHIYRVRHVKNLALDKLKKVGALGHIPAQWVKYLI